MIKILDFFDYARSESLWMAHFCTGCCSLEMAAAMGPRYDWERYGYMPTPTPRQADVLAEILPDDPLSFLDDLEVLERLGGNFE